MLRAYFDDSGTHDGSLSGPSKVIVMAGILGTEGELRGLEHEWLKLLNAPVDGTRPSLKRFHMAECQDSRGEFTGWKRTEVDYFCHQLGTVLIELGVAAYGMACFRKDWDDLIVGDVRAVQGDAEGNCVRNCMLKATGWAQKFTCDPEMTFIFDDRPARQRENKVVFDVYQRQALPPPDLVGIEFITSDKAIPLQAADLLAWEAYRNAVDVFEAGKLVPPKREQFNRLRRDMAIFDLQVARRNAIEKVRALSMSSPHLKEMAEHFRTFDPEGFVYKVQ